MSLVRWRAVDFPALLIEEWEDGYAVFHPASGQTYFLDSLGVQVLADLSDAPARSMDERELCLMLAARLGVDPDAIFTERVSTILRRLDEVGLLQKEPEGLQRAC